MCGPVLFYWQGLGNLEEPYPPLLLSLYSLYWSCHLSCIYSPAVSVSCPPIFGGGNLIRECYRIIIRDSGLILDVTWTIFIKENCQQHYEKPFGASDAFFVSFLLATYVCVCTMSCELSSWNTQHVLCSDCIQKISFIISLAMNNENIPKNLYEIRYFCRYYGSYQCWEVFFFKLYTNISLDKYPNVNFKCVQKGSQKGGLYCITKILDVYIDLYTYHMYTKAWKYNITGMLRVLT